MPTAALLERYFLFDTRVQLAMIDRMHCDEVVKFVVRAVFVSVMNLESIWEHIVRVPHPHQVANVDAGSLAAVEEVYSWIAMLTAVALIDALC